MNQSRAPFRTFTRTVQEDAHPNVLTDEERAYILDRIRNGAAPRAGLIRKLLKLADDRQHKLDRIARVVEQGRKTPHLYSGHGWCSAIGDLVDGDDTLG